MLKPGTLFVLWCMSIANFIFIAVKKMQRKRYERKERVLVSEFVCGCKQGDSRCRLGDLKGWKLAQYVKSNYSPASWEPSLGS